MFSLTQEQQNQFPHFLVIGSQRCASTWLYSVLKEHPEITLAPKEYRFWSNKIKTDSLSSYCKIFSEVDRNSINKIRGEVDPSYAAMRFEEISIVKQLVPNLQIVLIIRNPVDRLISQITRQWTYHYLDKPISNSRNIFTSLRTVDNDLSCRFTDYSLIYKKWSYFFGDKNIHLVLYDRLNFDSTQVIKEILLFLKVNPEFTFLNDNMLNRKKHESKVSKEEIPHFLKWYLAKKWLPKVRILQSELDINLSPWIKIMEKVASESKSYYYIIILIHTMYFLIPYSILYKTYNMVRIPIKIFQIKHNLKSQIYDCTI